MNKTKASLILLFIIFLTLILRLIPLDNLTRGSIDCGSGMMINMSEKPLSEVAEAVPVDQGLLKFYLLHFLLYFGRNDFILRVLPFILGVFSVFLLYYLGLLLFDVKSALLGSFFLSVSLWHIHYSMVVRNYMLYLFLVLLEVIFFWKAIKFNRTRDCCFFVIFAYLALQSFYPTIFILFAEILWLILSYRGKNINYKKIIFSIIAIILLFIPSINLLMRAFYYKVNFATGNWGWKGKEIIFSLLSHFGGIKNSLPLGFFVFLFSVFLMIYYKNKLKELSFLLFLVFIPIFLYVCCAGFFKISVIARYFLFIYPFFLLITAAGINCIRKRWLSVGLSFVFVLPLIIFFINSMGCNTYKYIPDDYTNNAHNFIALASIVEKNYHNIDYVIVVPSPCIFSLQYYLDKKNNSLVREMLPIDKANHQYVYKNDYVTIYGITDGFLFLKKIAAQGRVMIIDLGNLRYFDYGKESFNWVEENSYKVDHYKYSSIYFLNKF